MPSSLLRLTVAGLAATETFGLRRNRREARQGAEPPVVDGLYTWGSPASAEEPGLTNMRGDNPCFPGLRTATVKAKRLFNYMDTIVGLARPFGFHHPRMDVNELDVDDHESNITACSDEALKLPKRVPRVGMHLPSQYVFSLEEELKYTFIYNVSFMGCYLANLKDFPIVGGKVEEGLRMVGWRLAARASASGGIVVGGDQYSMLAQNPETLDCLLTFQATLSLGDVFTDMDIRKREFCSLPVRVHKGFQDHLMRMVKSYEWQSLIRPKLPHCNKVFVGGMSLGGANSELFTACVQNAPAGDEHYDALSWVKGPTKPVFE